MRCSNSYEIVYSQMELSYKPAEQNVAVDLSNQQALRALQIAILARRSTLQLAARSQGQGFFCLTIRDFVRPFKEGVKDAGR